MAYRPTRASKTPLARAWRKSASFRQVRASALPSTCVNLFESSSRHNRHRTHGVRGPATLAATRLGLPGLPVHECLDSRSSSSLTSPSCACHVQFSASHKLPLPSRLIPAAKVTDRLTSKWMGSVIFEGNTWEAYEAMREKDKRLHKPYANCSKKCLDLTLPLPAWGNLHR